jgi:serine/threonine-protein phosphatase 6 regulatory ankyrin repeat subunit B
VDVVRALLKQGANVDATDYGGWTALMWASQEGHAEVIQVLLSSGANVKIRGDDGKTAMLVAKNAEIKALLVHAKR